MKYYFQLDFNVPGFNEALFAFTPIDYFKEKGFLWDRRISADDVPLGFEFHHHGYYLYKGPLIEGILLLRNNPLFEEHDMLQAVNLHYYGVLNSRGVAERRRGFL